MDIIEVTAVGGPEVLRIAQRPIPSPAHDEVLIRVRAAGMNHADLAQRSGRYPLPAGASDILGLEVAGTVERVGDGVTAWKHGDAVCALLAGGGYAGYVTAPASLCLRIPPSLSFIQAAAIPEAFTTVWLNVFEKCGLQAGQTLLVHGGSSGVGIAAIQLAHALGSTVWCTAGSAVKCQACEDQGAFRAINYTEVDFEQAIKVGGPGHVDVILDIVGGDYFEKNMRLLGRDGRMAYISSLAGRRVTLDLVDLMRKRVALFGSVLRPLPIDTKADLLKRMASVVWPLLTDGTIVPLVHSEFSFESVTEAHALMERHGHIGKLILRVD